MEEEVPVWRSKISWAVLHPERAALFIEEPNEPLQLPALTRPFKNWLKIDGDLVREFVSQFKKDVIPLFLLDYQCDSVEKTEELLIVCEAKDPCHGEEPELWWDFKRLNAAVLLEPRQKTLLLQTLKDMKTGSVPKNCPEWGQRGWRWAAEAWIHSCFEGEGASVESIETLTHWDVSSLLLVRVGEENYYFKASPDFPCFVEEGLAMIRMSALVPEIVPQPLFVHETKNWMILEDLGEPLEATDVATLRRIVETIGRLQVQAVREQSVLKSLKWPRSNIDQLRLEIQEVMLCQEAREGLSEDELKRLQSYEPEITRMLEKLDSYSIPVSVNHGDLHGGNVIVRGSELVIFDWTWASIAHPFFDLLFLFLRNKETWRDYAPAYFQQWSEYQSVEACFEAWDVAYPLALLRMASRYRGFVASLEEATLNGFPKPVSHFLKHFLRAMEVSS